MSELTRILVPVDGSASADHAAHFAAALAKSAGAMLLLLHVHEIAPAEAMGMRSRDDEEMQRVREAVAKSAFREADPLAVAVPLEKRVVFGDPTTEIIRQAEAFGCELIVMGHRGRSQLKGLLLGSVSAKVVQLAPCAVTIVR